MSELNQPAKEKESFRQAMGWLHTWGGLVASWALFTIFLTGTIGVFDEDITHWMKPEAAAVSDFQPAAMTEQQRVDVIKKGQAYLQAHAPDSHFWRIGLPTETDPGIRVSWRDQQNTAQDTLLSLKTGEPMPVVENRETEGGHHFVHMHYEFHAGMAGIWFVGFFTMIMLVALISGIIIHKRIFKDFFTFRQKKGQRSWLDGHNASAVLTLPFQLMIAYTGLVIFLSIYMPAGVLANYSNPQQFFAELLDEPMHRPETGVHADVVDLSVLFQRAEVMMGKPGRFMSVEHPGDSSAVTKVFGWFDEKDYYGQLLRNEIGNVQFDATNGDVMNLNPPGEYDKGTPMAVQRVMRIMHFANFGGYSVRWLYFIMGMAGALMMATGAILFLVKRRQKSLNEFGAQTARVYRVIEVLNIAAISGLAVACIGYFWLNRLIPVDIADRAAWEIKGFFYLWLLMLFHSACRPATKAWFEQWSIFTLLALLLPVMNLITTGHWLVSYWQTGDWVSVGFELTVLVFGLMSLGLVLFLRRKLTAAQRYSQPAKRSEAIS